MRRIRRPREKTPEAKRMRCVRMIGRGLGLGWHGARSKHGKNGIIPRIFCIPAATLRRAVVVQELLGGMAALGKEWLAIWSGVIPSYTRRVERRMLGLQLCSAAPLDWDPAFSREMFLQGPSLCWCKSFIILGRWVSGASLGRPLSSGK